MTDFFASAASVHWRTPAEILDPVRQLFGGVIDLDPCGSEFGEPLASHSWVLPESNALHNHWGWRNTDRPRRTVFLNPPFGTSYVRRTILGPTPVCLSAAEMKKFREEDPLNAAVYHKQVTLDFAAKFIRECAANCEGVWISKAAVETSAIQFLLHWADAVCFPDHRINYVMPDTGKQKSGATFPSVLFYAGHRPEAFLATFSHLGKVINLKPKVSGLDIIEAA